MSLPPQPPPADSPDPKPERPPEQLSVQSSEQPPEQQPEKKPRTPRRAGPPGGCLFQIALVVGAALLLATLFTAWTPGQTNPSLLELFAAATPGPQTSGTPLSLQASPTFPPGAPTATLRNPRLVGIVAGHWKHDSGAVCPDGLTEGAINLEIATRVQKQLVEAGYEVDLLSEFDDRLRDYQAAALVSIHNDSCQFINTDATGYKVASAMATRHPEQAARLTACLRSRYGAASRLPLHSTSVTLDMTSYHAFAEIHESTPAAIIETGFLNLDRELLTQRPDVVAFGVASGILCYLKNEPISTPSASPPAQPSSTGLPPTGAALTPTLPGIYPYPSPNP